MSEPRADYLNGGPIPRPKHGRIHEMILEDPISQLNAPPPIVLAPSDSVADAAERMRSNRFGSVVVVEEGKLTGIFTEFDLLQRFGGKGTDLTAVRLGDVMTKSPQCVREDDTLAAALHRMAVGEFRHIPVLLAGAPIGFISIRGILAYIAQNALGLEPPPAE